VGNTSFYCWNWLDHLPKYPSYTSAGSVSALIEIETLLIYTIIRFAKSFMGGFVTRQQCQILLVWRWHDNGLSQLRKDFAKNWN
jgi:hypothetical protein